MSWKEEKIYENCVAYIHKVLGEMSASDNLRELHLSVDEKMDFIQIIGLCDRLKHEFDRLKNSEIENMSI